MKIINAAIAALAEITLVAFERLGEEDDGDAEPGDELPTPKSTNPDDVLDPRDELALEVAEWY
jgi:hypothetical protein